MHGFSVRTGAGMSGVCPHRQYALNELAPTVAARALTDLGCSRCPLAPAVTTQSPQRPACVTRSVHTSECSQTLRISVRASLTSAAHITRYPRRKHWCTALSLTMVNSPDYLALKNFYEFCGRNPNMEGQHGSILRKHSCVGPGLIPCTPPPVRASATALCRLT
jgi:hypothetical protein